MAELGFTTYVQPAPPVPPTLEERFAALTGPQKMSILNGFSDEIIPNDLKHTVNVPKDLITGVYYAIDEIEELSRSIMREEVIITEGTYDPETGEEITPPVYNNAPTTIAGLYADIQADADNIIFTNSEIEIVIDRMVLYSEIDNVDTYIGTWTSYSNNVIL